MGQHEVSEGWIGKVKQTKDKESTNYFMWLTIDGQKQRRATGTDDPDKATEMLAEWRAQAKLGFRKDARLRYEEIRDDYLSGGGKIQESVRRDLDVYFKDIRIGAIGDKLNAFREWRESLDRVVEYKQETLTKEIAFRKMKAMKDRKKALSAIEIAKIENEATEWVEKGVQTTTDKRLVYLRAMFYHAFEKTKKINLGDIPYFPIRGKAADNVRQGKFSEADFSNILAELPKYLHPLVKFLHLTGMRSGQAKAITWDMIDDDNVLRMPGFLTKNGQPYSLALTNRKGEPYEATAFIVNMKTRPHGELVFDTTNLREEWRLACHKLKLGMFDPKTRSYRGAQLHDFRRTAASNMNAKGIQEGKAMNVTGHKTNSMYKRYGIEELDSQRDALDAVTV